MEIIEIALNDFLIRIKEEYALANVDIANIIGVSPAAVTGYLNKSIILTKSNAEKVNDWLIQNKHKNLFSYIFAYTEESSYFFHGSKNQIIGQVKVDYGIREHDFGQGFYLGETFLQSAALAAERNNKGYLYKFEFDINKLRTITLEGLDWLFFIAINRNKIQLNDTTANIFKRYKQIIDSDYDVIIGKIADDRMAISMESFFNDDLYDVELFACLKKLALGNQYCIKHQSAIDQLKLVESYHLEKNLKEFIEEYAINSRNEAIEEADRIRNNHSINKRGGKTFDELIKDYGSK